MKRSGTLRIALLVAASAALAACSGAAASPSPKVYTYKDMTVGFIQTGSESGWRAANTSSFQETAKAEGITLKFYDSQNKIENQITAFNQYIQDPAVNVIVLAAVGTTGYDDVLKAAKAAGKVVVIEDRRIEADASLYYTYIGSDFQKEGVKSAAAMCDLLKAEGKATANIIELGGDQAASASIDRHKGFAEGLASCTTTKMTVLDYQNAPGWDPVQGKQIMEGFLKKYPGKIDGVYGHNDEQAIAGIQASEAAGLTAGKGGIVFVGVDATANGFKYLINGKLGADIECNPLLAPQVYGAALKALNGDTTTPKWVPSQEGEFFAAQGASALQAILDTRKY
jgi:galactofuranose transport system substrate-binding protein